MKNETNNNPVTSRVLGILEGKMEKHGCEPILVVSKSNPNEWWLDDISIVGDIREKVYELKALVFDIKDAEQDALDALPDAIRDGDRGQMMEDAVNALEEAYGAVMDEQLIDLLNCETSLEEARA